MHNTNYIINSYRFLLVSICITFCACNNDNTYIDSNDYSSMLTNVSEKVILSTYNEFKSHASQIRIQTELLISNQHSWIRFVEEGFLKAKANWQMTRAFLPGPEKQRDIEKSLVSWPIDTVAINEIVTSNIPINSSLIGQLDNSVKGLYAIEFLLFGGDGNKSEEDFRTRDYELLLELSIHFETMAIKLNSIWNPEEENYIANIIDAGKDTSIFPTQKTALIAIVQPLVELMDTMSSKMTFYLDEQDPTIVPSNYSDTTTKDYINMLRGIESIYTSNTSIGENNAIADIINNEDPQIHNQFIFSLQSSNSGYSLQQFTFSEGLTGNYSIRSRLILSNEGVIRLKEQFETEIIPIFEAL